MEVGFHTSMGKRGGLLQEKGFSGHMKIDSHPGYPHLDSLEKDFRPELFAKFTGSFLNNEIAYSDDTHDEQLVPSSDHKWSSRPGYACNPFWGEPELIGPKGDQICEPSFQQWQASPPSKGSREGASKIPLTSDGLSNWKMHRQEQKEDVQHKNRRGYSKNNSYFSKLAALSDQGMAQNVGTAKATASPVLSRIEAKSCEYANNLNPKASVWQHGHTKVIGHGVAFGNTASANNQVREPNSSFAASIVKGEQEKSYKKSVQPLLASSSTCSREASNYPSYSLKGKCQDSEESEQPSHVSDCSPSISTLTSQRSPLHGSMKLHVLLLVQSFEDEEPRSAAGAMSSRGASAGSKRNRSAEVHNVSEKVSDANLKPETQEKKEGKGREIMGPNLRFLAVLC